MLIWSGGDDGGAQVACWRSRSAAPGSTCRRRPTAGASPTPGRRPAMGRPRRQSRSRCSSSPATRPPTTRTPRDGRPGRVRARDRDVPSVGDPDGRSRPPGDELPRTRRHVRQPRGAASAAAPRGDPAGPRRASRSGPTGPAIRRPGLAVPVPGLRGGLGDRLWRDALRRDRRGGRASCSCPAGHVQGPGPGHGAKRRPTEEGCGWSPTGRCSRGPRSSAFRSSSSSGPTARWSSPQLTRSVGIAHGQDVTVRSNALP